VTIQDRATRPATGVAALGKEKTMTYKPYNESINETTPLNPHAPAPTNGRQTPVEIPGVMYQTRELFQPVVIKPEGDK
jgi:hypothetical protein